MKGSPQPWRQSAADHLGVFGGGVAVYLGRARPARLCLYALALAFAAFVAFVAFAPAPLPGPPAAARPSSSSSPGPASWFDGLVASASPYREQVSGFLSTLFPANSTSSSTVGAARRGGPGGGVFVASGPRAAGSGSISSSAATPREQSGSGGGAPISGTGGSLDGDRAPAGSATAAVPSGAPPVDHLRSGVEAGNSTWNAVQPRDGVVQMASGGGVSTSGTGGPLNGDRAPGNATAAVQGGAPTVDQLRGGTEAGNSSGRAVTEAKGAVDVPSGGGSTAIIVPAAVNGSSAGDGHGTAVKASARNAAGSTHQLGSAAAASGNGTAVPFGNETSVPSTNQTGSAVAAAMGGKGTAVAGNNQTVLVQVPAGNQSRVASGGSNSTVNKQKEATPASQQGIASLGKNHSAQAATPIANNSSAAPVKVAANAGRRKKVDWIDSMASCDMFYGNWVRDDSYPLYPAGSCPHVDESFNCHRNGRPDKDYLRLRWQPSGCRIPRLKPLDMLERLRGKRLVFVGDSLNRNMWESLICILRNSVKDKRKVFEVSGRQEFKAQGAYSFVFQDYNCTVEFFVSPFLVQEWVVPTRNGKGTRETLRLDMIDKAFPRYKNADIIVFNSGHWWTHDKTSLGKNYYQEGNHVYSELDVHEAYRRALNTWAKWVDSNIDPKKTTVLFRGYSASHFSGGQWNSGGSCDSETEPITNEKYLIPYPTKMTILEEVLHGMKTPVVYLNITRMTDYRKEGHPSVYRKHKLSEQEKRSPEVYQDCSHWCLPGVPDSWNELLYAQILVKQRQMMHQ